MTGHIKAGPTRTILASNQYILTKVKPTVNP
jgi:hypothetical protein